MEGVKPCFIAELLMICAKSGDLRYCIFNLVGYMIDFLNIFKHYT